MPADTVRADSTEGAVLCVKVSSIGPVAERRSRHEGHQHDGGGWRQVSGTLVRLELKSPDDSDTRPQQLVEALMRQAGRYEWCRKVGR